MLNPTILGFFADLFEVVGIRVVDMGEEFTFCLRGDSAEFVDGIDESGVDFVADIQPQSSQGWDLPFSHKLNCLNGVEAPVQGCT